MYFVLDCNLSSVSKHLQGHWSGSVTKLLFIVLIINLQVKLFMSLIPKKIIAQGKETTDMVLHHVNNSYEAGLNEPFLE